MLGPEPPASAAAIAAISGSIAGALTGERPILPRPWSSFSPICLLFFRSRRARAHCERSRTAARIRHFWTLPDGVIGKVQNYLMPTAERDRSQRSEENTSELHLLMSSQYAVFCLKKNNNTKTHKPETCTQRRRKTKH